MTEIWKDIKDHEGSYQISNLGRVKSLKRNAVIPVYTRQKDNKNVTHNEHKRKCIERILKLGQDKNGCLMVSLQNLGKSKTHKVHRLVALAFIDNPYQYPDVTHRDGNLENNCVSNLEWISTELTDEQKRINKIKYEREYRKRPKRIAWFHARLNTERYIKHVTSFKTRFNRSIKNAAKRNLTWSLTFEDFDSFLQKNCYYCDKSIQFEKGVSLDRINNSMGYELNNVVTCCGNCNKVRSNVLTMEEMKIAMKAVLEYRNLVKSKIGENNMFFNASQARKNAEDNKNQVSEVDHLMNHFNQLIKKASNQGKFLIEKQTFAADRFRQAVVDDVVAQLTANGYKVDLGKNNALNQIIFNVSW